ncbi:MAG: hypothetical protein ACYTDY_15965 [Planctomycetota bacterium]|jgi:hypothetical protein
MPWARILAAVLLLSGSAFAQAIDPNEFLPVGAFTVWELQEVGDPEDIEVVAVRRAFVADGVVQYRVVISSVGQLKNVVFVFGVDNGVLKAYGIKVTSGTFDSDFQVDRVDLKPPLDLADGSNTAVNTTIVVSAKIARKRVSAKFTVSGTVSSQWEALGGPLTTPAGTFDAADLARLRVTADLQFTSSNPDFDDENLFETVELVLARNVGLVQLDGKDGKQWKLTRAILPGTTVGTFPPLTGDVTKISLPTPNLLLLDGASADSVTDGFLNLSGLTLTHGLDGKLTLTGQVAAPGAAPKLEEGELLLKGKLKVLKTGGAKMTLKGKSRTATLQKPVVFKLKEEVTASTTEVTIAYKAGKDAAGEPITGTLASWTRSSTRRARGAFSGPRAR